MHPFCLVRESFVVTHPAPKPEPLGARVVWPALSVASEWVLNRGIVRLSLISQEMKNFLEA